MSKIAGSVAAAALLTAPIALAGPAAAAGPTGLVRIAHLSPGIGAVDVSFTGPTSDTVSGSGYGDVSAYQHLAPGVYQVAVRPTGQPSAAPLMGWALTVVAGRAYTLGAFGQPGHQIGEIFTDDQTRPAAGHALVRVIQGAPAAGKVSLTAIGAGLLTSGLSYGSVTGYAEVPAGPWKLGVIEDGKVATAAISVFAGHSYSVVVEQTVSGNVPMTIAGAPATGVDGVPVSLDAVNDAVGTGSPAQSAAAPEMSATPIGWAETGTGSDQSRRWIRSAIGGGVIIFLCGALSFAAALDRRGGRRRLPR